LRTYTLRRIPGLHVTAAENHNQATTAMIDHIEARIALLRTALPGRLTESGLKPATTAQYLRAAHPVLTDGLIGYTR
jgi:hypothetical protein